MNAKVKKLELQSKIVIFLKNCKFKMSGLKQYQLRNENKKLIKDSPIDSLQKKQLYYLNSYGKRYDEYIKEYIQCDLRIEKKIEIPSQKDNPIVICVVKNDLMRIKLFLKYYRNLGVKQFVFLDDHSTDGTKEHLVEQDDVMVFATDKNYTTIRRQVWINKIIAILGYNRWYLILDSDELFDYARSESVDLRSFVLGLEKKGQKCVKTLLLDMFSRNSLFADNVKNEDDIIEVCNMFCPKYRFVKNAFDVSIKGGAREVMFKQINSKASPVVSKYPLIYMEEDDIAINSHHLLPINKNYPIHASTVLRHYKFLPEDRRKYEERAAAGNFHNNSKEYITYLEMEKSSDYEKVIEQMMVYDSFESVCGLDVMNGEIL